MCDTGSSISFAVKLTVSTVHLHGQNASLSAAGFHLSQNVNIGIVPIAVSAHEKSQPMTTVQLCVQEKLNLVDQIVDLRGLKDRYTHLRNLPNQSYYLNEGQIILGQDCHDLHHPLDLKKSDD